MDGLNAHGLTEAEYVERFVTEMKRIAVAIQSPMTEQEVERHARECGPSYFPDCLDCGSPEEAARLDVSYWEAE